MCNKVKLGLRRVKDIAVFTISITLAPVYSVILYLIQRENKRF